MASFLEAEVDSCRPLKRSRQSGFNEPLVRGDWVTVVIGTHRVLLTMCRVLVVLLPVVHCQHGCILERERLLDWITFDESSRAHASCDVVAAGSRHRSKPRGGCHGCMQNVYAKVSAIACLGLSESALGCRVSFSAPLHSSSLLNAIFVRRPCLLRVRVALLCFTPFSIGLASRQRDSVRCVRWLPVIEVNCRDASSEWLQTPKWRINPYPSADPVPIKDSQHYSDHPVMKHIASVIGKHVFLIANECVV
uniref:Secreted protein n=1 Tax=Ascaris lumbricoides TaxID=6252 RepID=A0A0M3ILI8_ASCLU